MALHNEFGNKAEDMAARWLESKGYKILHRNWRFSKYEIDIIATRSDFLHFIEVKARHFSPYGNPEDSVGRQKFQFLQRAADHYLRMNPDHKWIQFDIVAITIFRDREAEFFLLEDVGW